MQKRLLMFALPMLVIILQGCGFQLRGSLNLPQGWEEISVTGVNPNGDLQRDFVVGLEAAGIEVSENGDITIALGKEEYSRRNVTIDSGASASEYEVELQTVISVADGDGTPILEPTEVAVQRLMNHDPNDVVGEAEEVRILRRELRAELVQNLLRRLRFMARAHAAET